MTNFTDSPLDRVYAAEQNRKGITLDAQEVADLIAELPDEDDIKEELNEEWGDKLSKVDVQALNVTKKAQKAIAEALGLDADELWPKKS